MAPKIKVSYEDIIAGTINVIRDEGFEAVNARSIAARLNCSTQPVMRTFKTMDEVKAAVYKRIEEMYNKTMFEAMCSNDRGFLAMGLAYINFAKTEPNLFKLLFMSNAFNKGSAADIAGTAQGDVEVIAYISEMTGLNEHKSRELFNDVWFTAHGIASLIVTNSCTINEKEAEKVLTHAFIGFLHSIKSEGDNKI